MDNLQKIFKSKLVQSKISNQVPIACSIMNLYEHHQNLLSLTQQRREKIGQKNKRVAFQSLQYRESLNKNLKQLQANNDKKHKEALNKVIKSQQRKRNYRKEIFQKHMEKEKNQLRDRIKSFKERNSDMQNFWTQRKLRTQKSYRIQTSAKPLFHEAVSKKKYIQNCQSEKGMQVKKSLLEKHEGRFQRVYKTYQKKKQQILIPHTELISKTLQKNEEIIEQRENYIINSIALHFDKSKDVLKSNHKKLQKKLKDKIIDDQNQMSTVKSNFIERFKQKSAHYSECKCKRINNVNVEPGLTKSIALQQENRSSLFLDTLKKLQKNDSLVASTRKQFMKRSISMKQSVLSNKDQLQLQKHNQASDRLRRQRQIGNALNLKKSLQIQSNCHVRKLNVK